MVTRANLRWKRLPASPTGTVAASPRLRRLDYSVDILGSGPAVHYPSEYREFDGIMVPTRRRVYVRNPDGSPVLDSVSVAVDVDVTDVTFS
jgi:hypothetical protein